MSSGRARRVLVIGLDGLEPLIVEPMLAAGELPNLARIRERGGYSRLATTFPAQTPVAWSSFATACFFWLSLDRTAARDCSTFAR